MAGGWNKGFHEEVLGLAEGWFMHHYVEMLYARTAS
jgi:hypothetical protein